MQELLSCLIANLYDKKKIYIKRKFFLKVSNNSTGINLLEWGVKNFLLTQEYANLIFITSSETYKSICKIVSGRF